MCPAPDCGLLPGAGGAGLAGSGRHAGGHVRRQQPAAGRMVPAVAAAVAACHRAAHGRGAGQRGAGLAGGAAGEGSEQVRQRAWHAYQAE